jgi:hypothetical protein
MLTRLRQPVVERPIPIDYSIAASFTVLAAAE